MADLHQADSITTLHRLRRDRLPSMEAELQRFARRKGIGLVLPALISEFERPAMRTIVRELRDVSYLRRIVVAVGRATREQVDDAWEFFRDFRSPVTLLWVEDPRVQSVFKRLEELNIPASVDGKGRTCWLSFGYLLAEGMCDVIALHDCDIVNYNREIVARLCYPLVHPSLEFEFAKGYYARATDRMHGRVKRLFLGPLLGALRQSVGDCDFLDYLSEFRYALAGEFAMDASLARKSRMPADWGLEIGMLSEAYRHTARTRICQTDIADNYEHKHQDISAGDASGGLRRMTLDIAKALFRCAAAEGVPLTADCLRNIQAMYQRIAEDSLDRYHADAVVNGIGYDRHCEESTIQAFGLSLREAVASYVENPIEGVRLPSWNRVEAADPSLMDQLLDCAMERPEPARVFMPDWNVGAQSSDNLIENTA